MRDTPAYLEAPDNEDSEAECVVCGECAWDELIDTHYEGLCRYCMDEAQYEAAMEERAEWLADKEYDD